jgi:hypothetical protein
VARTYPFSAGTLAVEGGVPFGVAASTVVTFSTAAPCNKNRHMCWYGTSGAGKGYSLRVLLSRERFANGLRIYGVDQDEQSESRAVSATTSTARACQFEMSPTLRRSRLTNWPIPTS